MLRNNRPVYGVAMVTNALKLLECLTGSIVVAIV